MQHSFDGNTRSGGRPFDFAFRYQYQSGKDSPDGYVEYSIEIAPDGSGEIHYQDDGAYQSDDYAAVFQPDEDKLERVYRLMLANGVLEPMWQPPRFQPKEDDAIVRLDVTCGGNFFEIPPSMAASGLPELQPIFEAIRALVNKNIWDKIEQNRFKPD